MYLICKVGTQSSVLINKVSLFQRCPLREVPLVKLWRPQHLQESINTSCLVLGTVNAKFPPHETTCLPDVTLHTKISLAF